MMTVKKSGRAGKAKVTLVLSAVVVLCLVMIQCNSQIDEQVLLEPQASSYPEISSGINVPILPESGYKFNLNPSTSTMNLTISENNITINGEVVEVDEITLILKKVSDEQDVVVAQIDGNQPMALVRDVQEEFRKADRLKFLYIGQTSTGEQVKIPILLPPAPESESGGQRPAIDENYARENNIGLLKIEMGEDTGPAQQQKVYDFVKHQLAEQNLFYVVSARFSNNDTYNEYLISLYHLQEGYYQIYGERAQERYGKSFREIFENRTTNEKYGKMYDAIRQEIPMNLSIAEG